MKKPRAAGHYSPSVSFGNLIFTSGQLPVINSVTKEVPESITAQTLVTLQKIENLLKEKGLDRTHILKTTAFITDGKYWPEVNQVYADFFGNHKPARSIIPISSLNYGAKIEIEAIAGSTD